MNVSSHKRSEHITFHSLGIADGNYVIDHKKWPMKTFDTILRDNGHSGVSLVSLSLFRDCSELVLLLGGVPVSNAVSEGGYEYFTKVPRGGYPFFANTKTK